MKMISVILVFLASATAFGFSPYECEQLSGNQEHSLKLSIEGGDFFAYFWDNDSTYKIECQPAGNTTLYRCDDLGLYVDIEDSGYTTVQDEGLYLFNEFQCPIVFAE